MKKQYQAVKTSTILNVLALTAAFLALISMGFIMGIFAHAGSANVAAQAVDTERNGAVAVIEQSLSPFRTRTTNAAGVNKF